MDRGGMDEGVVMARKWQDILGRILHPSKCESGGRTSVNAFFNSQRLDILLSTG
jgi:hypothetical protein